MFDRLTAERNSLKNGKNILCGCCLKRIKLKNAKRVTNPYAVQYLINKHPDFHKSAKVCSKCYTEAYKKNKKIVLRRSVPNSTSENVYDGRNLLSTSDNQIDVDLHVTPTSTNNKSNESGDVTLNIKRTIKTHSSCIIQGWAEEPDTF